MTREEIDKLYYIAPLANIPSILQRDLLSHNSAKKFQQTDLSDAKVQELRRKKKVPQGRPLHDYVNLYFNPRNKMMFAIKDKRNKIIVLQINAGILDKPTTIISSCNASSRYAMFLEPELGLKKLNHSEVFIEQWDDPYDKFNSWRLGSIVCAEVLVPDKLTASYILGTIVVSEKVKSKFEELETGLACTIKPDIFFG